MKTITHSKNRNEFLLRISRLFLLFFLVGSVCIQAQTIDCVNLPVWEGGKVYASPTDVQHEGKAYRNKYWTQGDNPAQSGQWGAWSFLGDCIFGNQLPKAEITSPAEGASFMEGQSIVINADASDVDGTVTQVEFFAGTVSLGVDLTAPYSATFTGGAIGNHVLTAVATDNGLETGTSVAVNITITAILPTVEITAPANGSTFVNGDVVNITATAADQAGSVSKVEFFVDGLTIGVDNAAPYAAQWRASTFGAHEITAVVTDESNNTNRSNVVSVSVKKHDKTVVGYITNWDAWKTTSAGVPTPGAYTHLNIDYSKYSILNFSFFGVANDGTLHSGDYRDKNIWQDNVSQQPMDLFYTATHSSWDLLLLFGEIELIQSLNADAVARCRAQGFEVEEGGSSWYHPVWELGGGLPVPCPVKGGAPGLLDKAHQNGVKVMASIGGWSMCKHFPEMAADPAKRERFVNDCVRLINIGFDGIDLDWEYPGPYSGMNFVGTEADYANFSTLIQEIRNAIGADKLITAAFSASATKLNGFNWAHLASTMDHFNMMTYDMNGGWSNIAGHNSPVYPYTGREASFSWQETLDAMLAAGVPREKINFGLAFYGRGVITDGNAALNAPTVKRDETIQPDGPISTCADYTNWPKEVYDGTPNYGFVKQNTGLGTANGWTRHWDDEAKVPYLTNGKYFLSYDDEQSIQIKSEYIVDNQLGGAIVWTVYGDLEFGGSVTNHGTKLKSWSNMTHELIDKVDDVFTIYQGGGNLAPTVAITAPETNTYFPPNSNLTITANAADADGTVTQVEFFQGNVSVGVDATAPYSVVWNNVPTGAYALTAVATDDSLATTVSAVVNVSAGTHVNVPPTVAITAPVDGDLHYLGSPITITASAADEDGTVTQVEFFNRAISLGIATAAPYTVQVLNPVLGTYNFTAVATDNEQASTTSAVVGVLVENEPDCTAPQFVSGTAYGAGAEVKNNSTKYKCDVPGWCSSTSDWAYEPGVGMYWTMAWSEVGPCRTALKALQLEVAKSVYTDQVSFFPNPFAEKLEINLSISADDYVSVKLFSGSGTMVGLPVNGNLTAGDYTYSFDASGLPSGVYIYQVTIGEEIITGKILHKE